MALVMVSNFEIVHEYLRIYENNLHRVSFDRGTRWNLIYTKNILTLFRYALFCTAVEDNIFDGIVKKNVHKSAHDFIFI